MVFDRRGVSRVEAWPRPSAAGAEGVGEGPDEGHPALGSASCMRSIGSDASSSDVDLTLDPINNFVSAAS